MRLSYGLVGLPNVGKSTLFNALSNAKAESANYPFCTIEPNIGVAEVPDPRLNRLAACVNPEKILPATLNFKDIAGLVEGASEGAGLGNQFLSHIREVSALLYVVRCFDDPAITHVAGGVDPLFDKELIDRELQLKDIATLKKRLEKVKKQRGGLDKLGKEEVKLIEQLLPHLANQKNARTYPFAADQLPLALSCSLLTLKPIVYVANVNEETLKAGTNPHVEALRAVVNKEKAPLLMICAALEAEMAAFSPEEKKVLLKEYQLKESGLSHLIRTSYRLLSLITYFTAGKKEVRAWTISKGTTAPFAAGVIHTDLMKTFIKAEVVGYDDYISFGGEQACKEAGKVRIEGKTYQVQDGDVIHFRCR